mgnify:CR=1 FL=1
MKQLDRIQAFGIIAILMIIIGDVLIGIYIKEISECLLVSWLFNFMVAAGFHFSTK